MHIYLTQKEAVCIVAVHGRLDAESAPVFTQRLEEVIARGTTYCIVNGSALEYISSAGLRSVLTIGKALQTQGGKLAFAALPNTVQEIFEMTGFTVLFATYASEDEALVQA
jgi:anti-sigma B factor antagonist